MPALERTCAIGAKKGNCVGESVHPLLVVCASESLVARFSFATKTYQERKTCGGLVQDLDCLVSSTCSFPPRTNMWGSCFFNHGNHLSTGTCSLAKGTKAQATCSLYRGKGSSDL